MIAPHWQARLESTSVPPMAEPERAGRYAASALLLLAIWSLAIMSWLSPLISSVPANEPGETTTMDTRAAPGPVAEGDVREQAANHGEGALMLAGDEDLVIGVSGDRAHEGSFTDAVAVALKALVMNRQIADCLAEWQLARSMYGQLISQQARLAAEISATSAELRTLRRLAAQQVKERVMWRKLESDKVHESVRMLLTELAAAREKLGQKFVEGSPILAREDELIAAAATRLAVIPEQRETERLVAADPALLWLQARCGQTEARLEKLMAKGLVVTDQLEAVKARLEQYRELALKVMQWNPGVLRQLIDPAAEESP